MRECNHHSIKHTNFHHVKLFINSTPQKDDLDL